jgi:hypothetical protein
MARFSSRRAFRPNCFGRQARIFNVLSGLQANRFEELNNYSGGLTRRKYDDSVGHRYVRDAKRRRRKRLDL